MIRASITALGHYLPEDRLTNEDLERLVDTNDEWIRSRTGVRERRILWDKDKATSYMATEACKEALAKRGVEPEEIDVIILATITPDMHFPAAACLVQAQLGATKAWAFDLMAACSGFLFGLCTGASFIESGRYEKVLVIGAEKMSTIIDYTDRNTCVLFGDGAGAALLEPDTEGYGLIDSVNYCDGSGSEALCIPAGGSLHPPTYETVERKMHYVQQEGRTVFKAAVAGMANVAAEIMARNQLTSDDIRYLVPHQANERIIDATARRIGLTRDKVMLNVSRYGNTTGATIPLCLYDWQPELRRGDNLVLAAFGGGFTWGAAYLKWAYDTPQRVPASEAQAEMMKRET